MKLSPVEKEKLRELSENAAEGVDDEKTQEEMKKFCDEVMERVKNENKHADTKRIENVSSLLDTHGFWEN